ncbi:hypothetical protein JFT81_16360 [Pseudomonas sp. TH43]|uniref:hypothetical protein n=1 Tax=Pseudomonas sp. TH43 TaxID=2796407 RepID=UPI0019138919|nr:hypothetical protein [Pseudomonas sp. TH43]MBK5376205.1 hypothetical protein [Pseudomonas sp. TH43]
MGSPLNPNDSVDGESEQVLTVTSQHLSRAAVASTRRGIDDLTQGIQHIERSLLQQGFSSTNQQTAVEVAEQFLEAQRLKAELGRALARTEAILPSHGNAKLTEEEKNQIRGLYASGLYTQAQLARQYGVQQPTISEIVRS